MSHIIYLNAIHFFIFTPLLILIFKFVLKFVFVQLKDLSLVDFWEIVIGELCCTCPWPHLGRIKARGPQFVMTTFYLLSNLVYIYFLQNTHFLEKRSGATLYCYLLYFCGFISYATTILRFYIFPLDKKLLIDEEHVSQSQDQELELRNHC